MKQQNLIPDYLDGSRKTNIKTLNLLASFSKYTEIITEVDTNQCFWDFKKTENKEESLFAYQLSQQDSSVSLFFRTYKRYKELEHKNYIVFRPLMEALSQTPLDITSDYMPKSFNAYMEIKGLKDNEGDIIDGLFVSVFDTFGEHTIQCFYLCNNYEHFGYLNFQLLKDKPIQEYIGEYNASVLSYTSDGKITKEEKPLEYFNFVHTILNSVIYISSSNADLVRAVNVFSSKKGAKKQKIEQRNYTPKPFILVGNNFKVPSKKLCGDGFVSGHWRWQRHGIKMSLIKHIYIDPYIKPTLIKNKEESLNIPKNFVEVNNVNSL